MKGQKTGGRTKGTPNKTTAEIKTILTKFVGDNIDQLQDDFDKLDPVQRLQFMRDVLRFVVPTMSSSKIDADIHDKGEQTLIIKGVKFAEMEHKH